MPKKAKELSAREVSRITKSGSHAVGGVAGLLLRINQAGARSWVLRVVIGARVNSKGVTVPRRRDIGLGGYPDITLAMARDKARQARELIVEGIDPIEHRRAQQNALQAELDSRLTFQEAAEQCHAVRSAAFKNEKHAAQWLTTIRTYANPHIGHLPVDTIEAHHIEKILKPIWQDKTETAQRVRQRVETIIRWAYTKKGVNLQNPARWDDNLKELLPNPQKIQKRKHFKALAPKDMPEFVTRLRKKGGMGAKALEFAILTAARSGEVRGATWGEINLEQSTWQIPGERMKAGKTHTVPLSESARALLQRLPKGEDGELVFKAIRGGALSDMTLSKVLRDMEVPAVPHGMRSTFKIWAQELAVYPDEASELALAHVNSDATRAAYARSELIDIRRGMMADWANFINAEEAGREGRESSRELDS